MWNRKPITDLPDVIQTIKSTFNLPSELDNYWGITDTYPPIKDLNGERPMFVMINHHDDFVPNIREQIELKNVNGLLVNLETGWTNPTMVNLPYVINEPLSLVDDEGDMKANLLYPKYNTKNANEEPRLEDQDIILESPIIELGYEGVPIRIFCYNGVRFFSTDKRINGRNSRWGTSPLYIDLFNELADIPEEVYNDEDHCYFFLLAHKDLRIVSTTEDSKLIYNGAMPMRKDVAGPPIYFPMTDKMIRRPVIRDLELSSKYLFPKNYDLPERNVSEIVYVDSVPIDVLPKNVGSCGDFIIVKTVDPTGDILNNFKFMSREYLDRLNVASDYPNTYNRYIHLVNPETYNDMKKIYQTMAFNKDVNKRVPMKQVNETFKQNLVLTAEALFDSVSPTRKDGILNYPNRYLNDIKNLVNFILLSRKTPIDSEEIKRFTNKAKAKIINLIRVQNANSIKTQLYDEQASTLFQMFKGYDNIIKYRNRKRDLENPDNFPIIQ